ncbi:alpha/beta hydrolase [Kitasatospora sp. NPDC091207]|uniref:alpha/beta hydrolase n=1 Tax=Kitasatospora sp. NPDC091207 TaxID=3364083 RepID=UPI003805030D
MGLTSHKLLALCAVLAVLSVLATLWIWPRLAYRSWPALFSRLATIASTQVLLLCTLGLLANDYFVFYSSWGDLLGHNRQTATIQGTGHSPGTGTGTGAAGVQLLGREQVPATGSLGQDPAQVGRLDRVRIPGGSTGLSTDGYVYLPPQYFQEPFKDQRFPAVVVMTGFPGDAKNLITKLRYPATELQLIRSGAMQPTIQVLMRPSPSMPQDSECEDIPGGPQAQTYFTTDVPRDLRASYRILSGGGSLGVMGDSTGGYCALKLAMEHPDVFAAAVSLSGYFKAAEDLTTGDLFAGSRQRRDQADLNWRLAHLPAPPVAVLLADSKEDGSTYADSRAFAAAARPPMTVTQATVDAGGHNFTTWVRLLPPSLSWLSTHLSTPARPGASPSAAPIPPSR